MKTIKEYKLMDYPCLYYINEKVNDKTVCQFLCGLGTLFGLDASAVSDSSKLFAAGSRVLFNGRGFSKEEVIEYSGDVFKRPFSSCEVLTRWKIVRRLDLKKKCCIICPLSTTYKNGRMDTERMVLRGALKDGKITSLPSSAFNSVVSVYPGNDVSNYPLISLLAMLNQYIIDNDNRNNSPYTDSDKLIKSFSDYVCEKLSYSDIKHKNDIFSCVEREIEMLYDYDFSTINFNSVGELYFELTSPYEYTAPRVVRPNASDDLPPVVPAKKKRYRKDQSLPSQKVLIEGNYEDKDKVSKQTKSVSKSGDLSPSKGNTPKSDKTPLKTENKHIEEVDKCVGVEESKKSFDNSNSEVVSDPVLKTDDEFVKEGFKYNITSSFANKILHCTDDNAEAVHNFISDICTSQYVSAESVTLNNRPGLLLMTCSSKKYYFFDIKLAPPGYLSPALSDASNIKLLSLHPLPVISMLSKLGFNKLQVESLSGLYCIVNNLEEISSYEDIFKNELSIGNEGSLDFYEFCMRNYEKLYLRLIKKVSSNEELNKIYSEGVKFDLVLGGNYDLSHIVFGLDRSISGHGFFDYHFNYNKDVPFIKKGLLFVVNLDMKIDNKSKDIIEFFEEVAIQVSKSTLLCVKHANLISVLENGIMYYSTMYGDTFFDILVNAVRKNFKKYYSGTPSLKTYRVEYK